MASQQPGQSLWIDLSCSTHPHAPMSCTLGSRRSPACRCIFSSRLGLEWIALSASSWKVHSEYIDKYLHGVSKHTFVGLPRCSLQVQSVDVDSFRSTAQTFLFGHVSKFEWEDQLINGYLFIRLSCKLLKHASQKPLREEECTHPIWVDKTFSHPLPDKSHPQFKIFDPWAQRFQGKISYFLPILRYLSYQQIIEHWVKFIRQKNYTIDCIFQIFKWGLDNFDKPIKSVHFLK